MSELNINSLSRSVGVEKSLNTPASQKSEQTKRSSSDPDSVQFSKDLNIKDIPIEENEQRVEEEFAVLRERLRASVDSPDYPSASTIDHLVSILASEIAARPHTSR